MKSRLIGLLTVLAGVALSLVVVMGWASNADEIAAQQAPRIAPGPLRCDFDGYEGILNYEEASRGERDAYAIGMGYANRGKKETHDTLRAAFVSLTFDPARAPIVSADLETARLHVFDCKTDQCSREEIARDAPKACLDDLGSASCMTFAVRVGGRYYCTLGPGLNQ